MIEGARDIVCNTGPIIHLDELGCLDLLADFTEILLPVWMGMMFGPFRIGST